MEFYAPRCGDRKQPTPIHEELGKVYAGEELSASLLLIVSLLLLTVISNYTNTT